MTAIRTATAICVTTLFLVTTMARGQVSTPPGYQLGPDDVLEINVWPQSDFTRTVTVGPDGRIAVPPVGEFYVAGLTTIAVAARVSDQLRRYLKDARVTVAVTKFRGKHVSVLGQVQKPGQYTLREDASLAEALAAAGGPTFAARLQRVVVLRGQPASPRALVVNFDRIFAGEDRTPDLLLQTGDVIMVPGTTADALAELGKNVPHITIQIRMQGQVP